MTDLNALLAHQEQAVRRARAKAGDLAHGLKTPLAILAHEADRAAAQGQTELAAAMNEQVERMRRQIDYHLAHARAAASGATPGARASIVESAQALARTMLRLHADRGLDDRRPRRSGARGPMRSRRSRRDARESARQRMQVGPVRVRVTSAANSAGSIDVVVEDDGPGIEPALREAVLQRGVRADEAAPGSGFGLAIVCELAELYGGSLALGGIPRAGLSATLNLPRP